MSNENLSTTSFGLLAFTQNEDGFEVLCLYQVVCDGGFTIKRDNSIPTFTFDPSLRYEPEEELVEELPPTELKGSFEIVFNDNFPRLLLQSLNNVE